MMRVNHSCEPNVGVGGNVLLVSMRDIAAGEEITVDYALFLTDPDFAMECHCGTAACRGIVTGIDWLRAGVQERYRGWFSWWLQQKITATRDDPTTGAGQQALTPTSMPAGPVAADWPHSARCACRVRRRVKRAGVMPGAATSSRRRRRSVEPLR